MEVRRLRLENAELRQRLAGIEAEAVEGAVLQPQVMSCMENITRQHFQEKEQQALSGVREEVWKMRNVGDISRVLGKIQEVLELMEIPFQDCAVNVVGRSGPPAKPFAPEMLLLKVREVLNATADAS